MAISVKLDAAPEDVQIYLAFVVALLVFPGVPVDEFIGHLHEKRDSLVNRFSFFTKRGDEGKESRVRIDKASRWASVHPQLESLSNFVDEGFRLEVFLIGTSQVLVCKRLEGQRYSPKRRRRSAFANLMIGCEKNLC